MIFSKLAEMVGNLLLKSVGVKRLTAFIGMWITAKYPGLAGPELNELIQYLMMALFGIGQAQAMGIIPEKGERK
jgi:hypothetical protein